MRTCVLGDGGWGTTLALLLYKKGIAVTLWGAFPEYASYLDRKRTNTKFLTGIKIPRGIEITPDLKKALKDKELIILAIPSQHLRKILIRLKKSDYPRPQLPGEAACNFLNTLQPPATGQAPSKDQIDPHTV